MKKLTTFLFVVGLFLSTSLLAQTAKGSWDLFFDSTGVATGNVEVTAMELFGGLAVKDYSGGAMLPNAVKIDLGGEQWPADSMPNWDRYVQFTISPKAGYDLTVSALICYMATYGNHKTFFANVYWDKDPSFATKVIIDTSTAYLFDVRDETIPLYSYEMDAKIKDGETFYVRFYPWYSKGGSSSKYFELQLVELTGTTSIATAVEDEQVPTEFALQQNYPNPFNPTTSIQFDIPKEGNYSLKVYNLLGQEVATLVNGQMNIGTHNVNFDASNLTSGMYIYRLTGNNVNLTRKMLLMK